MIDHVTVPVNDLVMSKIFYEKALAPFNYQVSFGGEGKFWAFDKRTHHVHIVESTSKHWSGKINFRDYLTAHPEVAKEYQELKTKLAQQYTYDREEYTNAKGEFVNKILKLAQKNNNSL